jgi:hypothetical protein
MKAFEGQEAIPGAASPPPPLSSAQQKAVEQQLASLRRNSGSEAALLVHSSGVMRAIDCLEATIDAGALCQAAMDAQRSIAQALARAFHNEASIQQSYYGTTNYSVCIFRLNTTHAIVAIFGPAIREGHIWYYMREAAEALNETLTSEPEPTLTRRSRILGEGASMVEKYFASLSARRLPARETDTPADERDTTVPGVRPRRGRRSGRTARAGRGFHSLAPRQASSSRSEAETAPTEPSAQRHAVPDPVSRPDPAVSPPPSAPEAASPITEPDTLPLDEIDWNAAANQVADAPAEEAWDALISSVDTGFGGMDLDEAKRRGLIDDLQAPTSGADPTDAR